MPLASRELLPPPPTYPPLPQEQSQLPPPASVPAVQPTGTPPLGPVSEIQTGLTSAAMCDQSERGSALSCCPFGFNLIASVPKYCASMCFLSVTMWHRMPNADVQQLWSKRHFRGRCSRRSGTAGCWSQAFSTPCGGGKLICGVNFRRRGTSESTRWIWLTESNNHALWHNAWLSIFKIITT